MSKQQNNGKQAVLQCNVYKLQNRIRLNAVKCQGSKFGAYMKRKI